MGGHFLRIPWYVWKPFSRDHGSKKTCETLGPYFGTNILTLGLRLRIDISADQASAICRIQEVFITQPSSQC